MAFVVKVMTPKPTISFGVGSSPAREDRFFLFSGFSHNINKLLSSLPVSKLVSAFYDLLSIVCSHGTVFT